jgi:putative acetyltransferase
MDIRLDDLTGVEIVDFLSEHLHDMRAITPEGSVYAHDLSRLRAPDVTFWSAWQGEDLVGCAALKELDSESGEVKSMRTVTTWRRRGVAAALLRHVVAEAVRRGYRDLYLETGATPAFDAARKLYATHGFEPCGAFGDYTDDPHSFYMRQRLP